MSERDGVEDWESISRGDDHTAILPLPFSFEILGTHRHTHGPVCFSNHGIEDSNRSLGHMGSSYLNQHATGWPPLFLQLYLFIYFFKRFFAMGNVCSPERGKKKSLPGAWKGIVIPKSLFLHYPPRIFLMHAHMSSLIFKLPDTELKPCWPCGNPAP